MDASRLRTGEIVAGIGGIALFVFLFFDWFGGDFGESVDGWGGLGADFSGFIVALTTVSGVALAGLAASGQRLNVPVPRGAITATLGSLSTLIILWRFFANPGDLEVGIFLGLAAAVAIAVGAWMALAEDGFQPFVAVAAPRTAAVAAASAPPATPSPPPTTTTTASKPRSKSSGTRRSTTKKSSSRSGSGKRSSGSTKPRSARSSGSKSSSTRSRAKTSTSRSSASRSKSTTKKRTKSTRPSAAKKSGSSKSRSSSGKRSSGSRKK